MKPKINHNSGLTLLEIAFGSVLLAVLLGSAMSSIIVGQNVYAETAKQNALDSQLRITLHRMTAEIHQAGVGTLFPEILWNSQSITFQQSEQFQNGVIVWGNPIIYSLQYADGELDNGFDDNGDGLIDEQNLIREQNNMQIPVCSDVSEGGLNLTSIDNTIQLALTLQSIDKNGRLLQRTLQTTVQLRN